MADGATQLPFDEQTLASLIESATARRVARLARSPWPYPSSAVIESLNVHWDDGSSDTILVKQSAGDDTPITSGRPAFLVNPARERMCYRMLADLGMDTPTFFGFDPQYQLLLIEQVDGAPLSQIEDVEAWCDAARWLAWFHRRFVQPIARPIEYDDLFYSRWLDRAEAFALPKNRDRFARVGSAYRAVLPRLLGLSIQPIHGEFVASNILIQQSPQGARVRVVDWEMASLGPPMMDLADLTSGDRPEETKRRMIDAYHEINPAYSDEALLLCRFARAVQRLGWAEGGRTLDEQDGLIDAESMLAEIERL